VVRGKLKLIRDDGKLKFSAGVLTVLGMPCSTELAEFIGDDYALVSEELLRDVEILAKEKSIEEARQMDLNRILSDYRKQRMERKG